MTRYSKDHIGLFILSGIVAILVVLGLMALVQHRRQGMVDEYTLCIKGRPPSERVIVMVDKTDPMSAKQIRALISRIRHIKDVELETNAMLSIFLVGDGEDGYLTRVFCLCNPGRDANPLIEDPVRVQARFDSLFGQPLEDALADLIKSESSQRSPLLEAIRRVSELQEFSPDAPRRLIIVSDMIQNTDGFSFYRGHPSFAQLKASSYYEHIRANLAEVEVQEIRILRRRDESVATAPLDRFWWQFFTDSGAKVLPAGIL